MEESKPRKDRNRSDAATQSVAGAKPKPVASKSMPSLVQRQATRNGRRGRRVPKGSEPDVEERSSEGLLAGSGLAERWMLRNATFEDILSVRANDQIRLIPGANQSVALRRRNNLAGDGTVERSEPSWASSHGDGRRSASSTTIKQPSTGRLSAPHYLQATRAQGRMKSLGELSHKNAPGSRTRTKMDKTELYRRAKDLYANSLLAPQKRP